MRPRFSFMRLAFAVGVLIAAVCAGATRPAAAQDPPIRVGVYNFEPLIFTDAEGKAAGLYIEVLEDIARQERWSLTYVPGSWSECLARLQAGEIDLLPSIGWSEPRAQTLDFTREFLYVDWGAVFTRQGSPIRAQPDLEGKRVGVLKDSIYTENFSAMLAAAGMTAEILEEDEYRHIFAEIAGGQLDAGISSELNGLRLRQDFPTVQETNILFSPIKIYFAAPRGRQAALLAALDEHIASLRADQKSYYYQRLRYWRAALTRPKLPAWVIWVGAILAGLLLLSAGFFIYTHRELLRRTLRLAATEQGRIADEARYRSLFENSPVALWEEDFSALKARFDRLRQAGVTDFRAHWEAHPEEVSELAGLVRILRINPASVKLLGATTEAEVIQPLPTYFNAASLRVFREEMIALAEGQTRFQSEISVLNMAHEPLLLDLTLVVPPGQEATLERVLVSFIDITERAQHLAALRASEERFRSIAEQTSDVVFVTDVRGVITYLSPACQTVFGFSPAEAQGQHFVGLLAPEFIEVALPAFRNAMENGLRSVNLALRMRRKDGTLFFGELNGAPFKVGSFVGSTGTIRDITERKEAEAALRESELRLRQVTDYMVDMVASVDAQERFTYVSPSYERILGYAAEELLGRWAGDWLHPDDAVQASDGIRAMLADDPQPLQFRYRRKDGVYIWLESTGRFLYDADGQIIGAVMGSRDITERKKAEEALRESEARFSTIFHVSPTGICLTELDDGRIEDVNEAFLNILGTSRAEVIGGTTLELGMWGQPADRRRVTEIVRREHGLRNVELPFRKKSGEPGYLLTSAELIEIGGRQFMLSMLNDITEHKLAEEKLRESEEYLRLGHEAAELGIWKTDLKTEAVHLDARAQAHYGFDTPNVTIEDLRNHTHPDDRQRRIAEFMAARVPTGSGKLASEYRVVHPDGSVRWLAINARVEFEGEGAGRHAVTVFGTTMDITERKRAELALHEAEERLHFALAKSHTGGWDLDLVDHTAFRTLEHDHIFGYETPLPAWTYEIFLQHVIPEDRAEVDRLFQQAVATQSDWSFECRIRRGDGAVRWIWATGGHQFDALGQARRMAGIVQDITERKEAAAALALSEARLRLAQAAAKVGAWEWDLRTNANTWSEEVYRLYGLEPYSVPASYAAWREAIRPEDRAQVEAATQEAARLGLEINTEWRVNLPAGAERWLMSRGQPARDAQGQVTAYRGVVIDITDRKRADAALRESEERYRRLLELAPVGIAVHSEGRIVFTNPAGARLLGAASEAQLIGRPITDIIHPDNLATSAARIRRMLAGEVGLYPVEDVYLRLDGTPIPVEVDATRLLYAGKPAVQVIVTDISARKQHEAERERLQAQLFQAQKMESVGRLAGGVAHDFNNMLQAILGYAALGLSVAEPGSNLREFLEQIRKAAGRSADLTRQLLAFARRQTINPVALDVNDAVSSMLKMLRRLIGEDIHLAWMPGPRLWKVRMDPVQIDQILANLAVNARDAIAGVGSLTIETANATLDAEFCRTHTDVAPGDYVRLTVADSGSGMSQEVLEHIFEPFFTTKGVGRGTGLGLATVFGIVKQNNGGIFVRSEPGQGTAFQIYLPRFQTAEEEEPAEDDTESDVVQTRGTETILLVEDEEAILHLGKRVLKGLGYVVLTAGAPSEAQRIAGEHAGPIDLLITDVIMPEMDGRRLADALLERYPDMRCVFMSGYTADIIARHGILEAGLIFLQKPFTPESLARKARQALDEPHK